MARTGGVNPAAQSASPARAERLGAALGWAAKNGPAALLEVGVNVALPYLVYALARPQLGEVGALVAASAPPLGWTLLELARHRRIDALSALVLAGLAASVVGFLGGGGARFLQLREQLVIALIGVVFLTSAAIGKPLILTLARARLRRRSAEEAHAFEALRDSPVFRRAMATMTLVWGFGMIAESVIAATLVFILTIPQYLIASPILGYGALAGFTAWTYWYARRRLAAARAVSGAAG
jgi:hypothetical protein